MFWLEEHYQNCDWGVAAYTAPPSAVLNGPVISYNQLMEKPRVDRCDASDQVYFEKSGTFQCS